MIETERLILRKFEDSDLDDIFAMRSDHDVMRYIRQPQTDPSESAKWIRLISSFWETEGIGYCALIEKATGHLVGWCGLWRLKETDEIEVGYAISKSNWGRVFATEAAAAVIGYGFKELGLGRIVAVAFPGNKASQNVMTKLGMSYVGIGVFYGNSLAQYAIERPVWEARFGDAKDQPDMKVLETKRHFMRRFTEDDLGFLLGHRTHEEIVKFLGGIDLQTPDFIKKRLNFYIGCYASHGFGMCAMHWKETGDIIGVAGLQPLEKTGEIEVGYSIDKPFWGKGIATESARAWLEYGFGTQGLDRIVAVADPENGASIRVMKKLGMKYEKTSFSYGMKVVQYAISKEKFSVLIHDH